MLASETLAHFVLRHPQAARVLRRHGVDYWCGGRRPFEEGCLAAGLDPATVQAEVEQESFLPAVPDDHWERRPLRSLIEHLVHDHHLALRHELRRLADTAHVVEDALRRPEQLQGLASLLDGIARSWQRQMDLEERELFPVLQVGPAAIRPVAAATLQQAHAHAVRDLAALRACTGGLEAPYETGWLGRTLYSDLARLDVQYTTHIHLENNVLIPRTLEDPARSR